MFPIAIAFLGGHAVVHCMPLLPSVWPGLPVLLVGGVAAGWFRRYWTAALLLGCAWAWSHAAWRLADELVAPLPIDAEVVGRVVSLPAVTHDAQGVSVHFGLAVAEADRELPDRIELTWYDFPGDVLPGELWRLRVRLRAPRGFANPGGADYEAQLFRGAVGATGYVLATKRDAPRNVRLAGAGWRYPVLRARAAIAQRLAHVLPNSSLLGIVQGLAVGDTQRITSQQWRVFANTGTSHLMAISGLHIAMVAMVAAWLVGIVARRLPLQARGLAVHDVQSSTGLAAAVLYSALAGLTVPTQRTLVMLTVYFATRLLRRQISATQGLSVALIGVLLVDPIAPLAPGFWLSFGAVFAIFLTMGGRVVPLHWAREYVSMQMAVSVGLLPFLVGAFGGVSVVSPLINLVAIPFFTFAVVPLVLLGSLLAMLAEPLGAPLLHFADALLAWSWPVAEWAAGLPLAMWRLPDLPTWISIAMLFGCWLCIAPGLWMTRLAGVMLCLPAFLWHPARSSVGAFELAVLDVGQGLATVVMTRNHVLIYDTGPRFRSGRDTGEMVVLPYLRSRGVHGVDILMASHGDNDHVGGMQSVLDGIRVLRVLTGPTVREPPHAERCVRGQSWEWDGVRFDVLHPSTPAHGTDNDLSCVLRIAGVGGSVLLLGDIERPAEERLVREGAIPRTDVVVIPHHGSRTSSTEELVVSSAPRLAVASAGYANRWGFPKEDVLTRWQAVGARILRTDEGGAIEIDVTSGGELDFHEYRRERRAYWRE